MSEPLYLRQNVQVEPLIDQWYAWSHLVSPATAARNITERHFKIMDSYINAPQIHANAVKNPKMLGGPFIDYGGKRTDEIKALKDKTQRDRAHMIELSRALTDLDQHLRINARGYSLQPLYKNIPAPLRGYVELFYDTNNCPSFRLLEPLLYKSRYYDRSAQSFMLSTITQDDRPFVLSTPRLEGKGLLHLRIPFDSDQIDELFKLKYSPKPFCEIKEILGISDKSEHALRELFTPDPPPKYEPYQGKGIRWRYFGHACILVETRETSFLFDPVLSYTYETDISRYTYADLPDVIDYLVITHNHQDHILFETLLQIRHKVRTVIVPRNGIGTLPDPSLKLMLQNCGFKHIIELDEMETVETDRGSITGLPFFGEHADLGIRTKLAYLIRTHQHSLLFAADSCNIEHELYDHLHEMVGDADILFLGMECDGAPLSWLYGPLFTHALDRGMDESRRLAGSNFAEAMDIVSRFGFRDVYVYAMGQEPWLNHIMSLKYTQASRPIVESNKLVEACRAKGIRSERLFGEKEILLS